VIKTNPSGTVCSFHQPYRPLESIVITFIRITHILKLLYITWPYKPLSLTHQNPDGVDMHSHAMLMI